MSSSPGEGLTDRAWWAGFAGIVLLAGAWQFSGTIDFPFHSDDFDYLRQAAATRADPSALFSPDYKSSGRLAVTLIVTAVHAASGDHPTPYRLVAVVAHLAAVFVLARSLQAIGCDRLLASLTGLLFLFTVSHYEVPYWLSCIAYPGCLIAGSLCFVRIHRYSTSGATSDLVASCLLGLVATAFHPAAVGFPLIGAVAALATPRSRRDRLTAAIPVGLSLVGVILIAVVYPGHMQLEAVERIDDPIHLAGQWLAGLGHVFLYPHWLSEAYVTRPGDLEALAGVVLLVAAGFALRQGRRTPAWAVLFAALFAAAFSGSAAPEYRPRYAYLPAVGPAFLYAWAIVRFADVYRQLRWIAITVPAAALILVGHHQLSRSELMHLAAVGRSTLGGGDPVAGLNLIERAAADAPDLLGAPVYTRYATLAIPLGRDPRPVLDAGLRHRPSDLLEDLNIVANAWATGTAPPDNWFDRPWDAEDEHTRAIAAAFNNAGIQATRAGRYPRAAGLFAHAIRLLPRYTRALANQVNAYALGGNLAAAVESGERLLAIGDTRQYPRVLPALVRLRARHPDGATLERLVDRLRVPASGAHD